MIGTIGKIAEFADFAAMSALREGDRDSRLMDIKSNENHIIH